MIIDEEELEQEMRWKVDHVRGGYSEAFTSNYVSPEQIINYLKLYDGEMEIVEDPNGWQCDMTYHVLMPDDTIFSVSSSAYSNETTFTKETDEDQIKHIIKWSGKYRT